MQILFCPYPGRLLERIRITSLTIEYVHVIDDYALIPSFFARRCFAEACLFVMGARTPTWLVPRFSGDFDLSSKSLAPTRVNGVAISDALGVSSQCSHMSS